MRNYILAVLMLVLACSPTLSAQKISIEQSKINYLSAKQEIEKMLSGKQPLSYEKAIFLVENAWWDNERSFAAFQDIISDDTLKIRAVLNRLKPHKEEEQKSNFFDALHDYNNEQKGYLPKAMANAAIFAFMTDTLFIVDSSDIIYHLPFRYASNDPLGSTDWKNTQVFNLLESGQGNCFALVSLFKIFSERFHSDASICTAPGHVYISHKDDKGIRYNVEIGSKVFPGIGTLSTLTHTTHDAIINDISLRELSLKQSVALSLVYLAKGYEHKFDPVANDGFIMDCANLVLKYDSMNLNAMLLKAEVFEKQLISKNKPVSQLQSDKTFASYQKLISSLCSLGYREMPLAMKNWLIKGWMKDTVTKLANQNYQPANNNTGMKPTRYASLSWGLFEEQISTQATERYGQTLFNTKTKKIVSFAKEDNIYNNYDFDPVVFAWNVDPLAHKMPNMSPYAFCVDNPIAFFDPDGAFPYSIHVRSFAPFETFGGRFKGDGSKRGFTTALGKGEGGSVTSKMQHKFTVDPTKGTLLPGNAWSDESSHPLLGKATAKTHANIKGFKTTTDKDGNSTATFSTNMASANPLVAGSPDIDVHTSFTIRENEKTGMLNIKVVQTGDAFPAAETFIGDTKGNQLFIGVSPAIGSPYTSLPGNGDEKMMSAEFNVTMDKSGVFTGVKSGDKSYTIEEWNKSMQSQSTTK